MTTLVVAQLSALIWAPGWCAAGAAPNYHLIRQGGGPTCWVVASMAALQYSGVDMSKLVKTRGKNQFEVRLHNFNNPAQRPKGGMHADKIEVQFDGKLVGGDAAHASRKDGWVVVLHRGFIEAVRKWDPSQSIEIPHGGGAADALAMLTGRWPEIIPVDAPDARKKVEAALNAHHAVVFGSKGEAKKVVSGHYFAVMKSSAHNVNLYNPWGSNVTVPWSVIKEEGTVFIIDPGPTQRNPR
jgi:hypothetical protein